MDVFSKSLVQVASAAGKTVILTRMFIDRELAETKGMQRRAIKLKVSSAINTLFRNNSLATKLFQNYARIVGLHYLWDTLGQFLTELIEEDEDVKDLESGGASRGGSINTFEVGLSNLFHINNRLIHPK